VVPYGKLEMEILADFLEQEQDEMVSVC
jgi:hypothetical protein